MADGGSLLYRYIHLGYERPKPFRQTLYAHSLSSEPLAPTTIEPKSSPDKDPEPPSNLQLVRQHGSFPDPYYKDTKIRYLQFSETRNPDRAL